MPFQREYRQISEWLRHWPQQESLWIHICSEDQSARKHLLNLLGKKPFSSFSIYLQFDFHHFPFHSWQHVRELLRYVLKLHEADLQAYLQQFPIRLEGTIRQALHRDDVPVGEARADDRWELHFLNEFMRYRAGRRPQLVLLNGFFEGDGEPLRQLQKVLGAPKDFPVCFISSGSREFNGADRIANFQQIVIGKRSVRETEQLVARVLATDPITTRLMTNQLYVKSAGQAQLIRFMLEAFYRPLLENAGSDVVGELDLQRKRVSGELPDIFQALCDQLPAGLSDLLAFLSRLEDPFPRPLLLALLKPLGFGKKNYQDWLGKGWMDEFRWLGEDYVQIGWQPWQAFLRQHTSIERVRSVLEILKSRLGRRPSQLPLELSSHFFEAGDHETALTLAYREAQDFERFGEGRRALERYAFLRRNLFRFPGSDIPLAAVLKKMGLLQKQLGLYENAFESFRELRESLKRSQREEWIAVSLEMADALFQMDALSEALYQIKEIKIKDSVSSYAYAFSNILMGELEQNFGHAQYALRYYEKALAILPRVQDEQLMMRLYAILKQIYSGANDLEKYIALIVQINQHLPADSPFKPEIQLELIKCYVHRNDFAAALPHAIAAFRHSRAVFTPRIAARVRLYLAEIYGYFGKWYLSRSYLRRISRTPVLLAHPRFQVQVMTTLGIVEKELGHYGAALEQLQQALAVCERHRMVREKYQIRVHLGHIYILVHGLMRARDHLSETLAWAEASQDEALIIQAALFLASYDLLQERLESARNYLHKAKTAINLLNNPFDRLNYLYYEVLYFLKSGELEKARATAEIWENDTRGIVKYEHLAYWLSGKVLLQLGNLAAAEKKLLAAWQRSRQYRLPYLTFQVSRDLEALARAADEPRRAERYHRQAREAFSQLLAGVDDEILQRQIEESQEYEGYLRLEG